MIWLQLLLQMLSTRPLDQNQTVLGSASNCSWLCIKPFLALNQTVLGSESNCSWLTTLSSDSPWAGALAVCTFALPAAI
jgi:hypothetical protein